MQKQLRTERICFCLKYPPFLPFSSFKKMCGKITKCPKRQDRVLKAQQVLLNTVPVLSGFCVAQGRKYLAICDGEGHVSVFFG